MVKTRKSIAVHVKENKARASKAGALLSAMRKNHRGGRPVTEPQCECGAMSLKRALARCHVLPSAPRQCRPGIGL